MSAEFLEYAENIDSDPRTHDFWCPNCLKIIKIQDVKDFCYPYDENSGDIWVRLHCPHCGQKVEKRDRKYFLEFFKAHVVIGRDVGDCDF